MRIVPSSSSYLAQQLSQLTAEETKITQQTASGSRLTTLADDPSASGQSVQLSSAMASADTFVQTAGTIQSRMQAADSALGSMVSTLTNAIALAIQGTDGSLNTSDLQLLAQQLTGVRDSAVSLANSSYQGTYLFAGTSTQQPYQVAADGTVSYSGDSQSSTLSIAGGGSIQTSLPGSTVFGTESAQDVFSALNQLISDFSSGTVSPSTADDINTLRSSLDNVMQQRSVLGSNTQRLTSASSMASTQKTNLQVAQTELVSADTASLATQLSAVVSRTSALSSTIAATQKGSLFDYL